MKIKIDRKLPTISTDFSWQFGIGNDHAFQMHRVDMCHHIKLVHDELGIRYLRFHGIFDDDMLTVQRMTDYSAYAAMPFAREIKEINFRQIGDVYDNVLDCGMKPFVELSFMPSALACGKTTGIRYQNNITQPKSYTEWAEYIRSFIRFLLDRYGSEEVRSWYFEVWNEPDLSIFFKGTQQDYFKLYEVTARAVKEVDSQLRIGGPSSSACKWIPEFLTYCKENNVPCDFVSTHHYPGDAYGNSFTPKDAIRLMNTTYQCKKNNVPLGDTITKLFFQPDVYKQWKKGTLVNMDSKAKKESEDKPLFVTEWNSMAVYGASVHDEKYSAAFVIKTCLDLQGETAGYMFWCCSDIYEEQFMLPKPFVGGFGLVSNDGIPKPNFWAFKMLSQLKEKRLVLPMRTNEAVEYAAFVDGEETQILVYAQDNDYEKNESMNIEISINQQVTKATIQRIDDNHCNPKVLWEKLGSPNNLTRAQVEDIKEQTALFEEEIPYQEEKGYTNISLSIHTNDVVLITLT